MTMNKPPIDDLLKQIPSYYELTVAAAQRATQIKRADREHLQPLQTALEEVAAGKIEVVYEADEPAQAELPLGAPDLTTLISNPTDFDPNPRTAPAIGIEEATPSILEQG
ncbi:MAG TPA: DNA-directed RNA polymerase subunit omega [bacterium]|nr:DNA-directed RNA polymerase subunit omega [bacterium]